MLRFGELRTAVTWPLAAQPSIGVTWLNNIAEVNVLWGYGPKYAKLPGAV